MAKKTMAQKQDRYPPEALPTVYVEGDDGVHRDTSGNPEPPTPPGVVSIRRATPPKRKWWQRR